MKAASGPLLQDYWVIGFSGHRHLPDKKIVADAIARELHRTQEEVSGKLTALSSIALGSDTLFAQQVIAAGIPWIALLPFAKDEFRSDFFPPREKSEEGPSGWDEAEKCLPHAIAVDVWSQKADRPNAYLDIGINMVEECDILFVVWDGKPAGGKGGTAEVASYAEKLARPLVVIDPLTGHARRHHWPKHRFSDDVFESLSKLADPSPARTSNEKSTALDYFFHRIDQVAQDGIPKVRAKEMRVFLYNSAAALVIGGSLALQWKVVDLVTVALIFIVLGFADALWLERTKKRHLLVHARLIAEICRSIRATRDFPDRLPDLYRSNVPRLQHLIRSLIWNRDLEAAQDLSGKKSLEDFRNRYIATRLDGHDGQLHYYRQQRDKSSSRAKYFSKATFCFSLAAVLVTGLFEVLSVMKSGTPFPFLYSLLPHAADQPILIEAPESRILDFLAIALPLAVSFCAALLSVNEHKWRGARYQEMEHLLANARLRLTHVLTHQAIRRTIIETESALLSENYQWYYHALDIEAH